MASTPPYRPSTPAIRRIGGVRHAPVNPCASTTHRSRSPAKWPASMRTPSAVNSTCGRTVIAPGYAG